MLGNLFGGERRVSATLRLDGVRWRSAHVVQRVRKAGLRATDAGVRRKVGAIRHVIVLAATEGEPVEVVLGSASSDERRAAELRHTRWKLALADDGHAIALSPDGSRWSYLALDVDQPFYCSHVCFGAASDAWQGAPSSRALLLEVLASSTRPGLGPPRNHCEITWRDDDGGRLLGKEHLIRMHHTWVAEARAALIWAGDHLADPEVRSALLHAAMRAGPQLDPVQDLLVETLGRAASPYLDVRHGLLLGLDSERWRRAVEGLALLNDDPVREQILDRLRSANWAESDEHGKLAALVWCLLRTGICEARAEHVHALERLAVAGDLADQPALRTASRLAVRVLARVGAVESLDRLSTGRRRAFTTGKVLREPTRAPLGELRSLPAELSDDRNVWYDVACHAVAAHEGLEVQ